MSDIPVGRVLLNDRLLGLAQRAKTPARSPRRGGDTDCDEKAASYRGDLQASRDKMCLFEKEEQNTFHQGGTYEQYRQWIGDHPDLF